MWLAEHSAAADRPFALRGGATPSNEGVGSKRSPCVRGIDGRRARREHRSMLTTTHSSLTEALTGAVVLPGDSGWDEARSGFNLLLDQHPAAVAFPADARDVAGAVAYARAAGPRGAPPAPAPHPRAPRGPGKNPLL